MLLIVKIITLSYLIFYSSFAIANDDWSDWKIKVKPAFLLFQSQKYKEAYEIIIDLDKSGNPFGTYLLGQMYELGLYVKKNEVKSYDTYVKSAKSGFEQPAYRLARNFFLNQSSKFFDEKIGLNTLLELEKRDHPDGTFYLGVWLAKNRKDKVSKKIAEKAFEKAWNLGILESGLLIYIKNRDEFNEGKVEKITKINYLIQASETKSKIQGHANFELAMLYKDEKHLPKNLKKYIYHLERAVDLGEARSALLLGKAYLLGMVEDPDYPSARFYLEFAQKNKIKGAEFALITLRKREKEEQTIDSFSTPVSIYNQFITSQIYSKKYNNMNKDNSIMNSYTSNGNTVIGSDGTRIKKSGNRIVTSEGTSYRIQGNMMKSSDGINYRLIGNSIKGSDGSSARIIGNTIKNSNGTRCRQVGISIKCY
ncbi:sel1 repeat family protein [Alphaproteobacteria bacterium]|nr:sel1 repeat family protein [Alphaproteobacteria bacterium]